MSSASLRNPSRDGRRRVVITAVGSLSALGDDEAFGHGLAQGTSGLGPLTAFDLAVAAERGADVAGCRQPQAGEVDFDPRRDLGAANVRPIDRTGRLVAAAAGRALRARGWSADDLQALEIGLVLGTMYGSVHTISAFDRRGLEAGPKYVKPLDFANSVINAAAGQTAIWHGLCGPNSTVAGGLTAGLQALGLATELVRGGRAAALLAGGSDELCLESYVAFVQAGLVAGTSTGAHGDAPRALPFDARRDGFVPAEAAALFLLEDAEGAGARGAHVLGEIVGHACVFDPRRGRDPERAAATLRRAISDALADAALDASALDDGAIDVVSSGASGSRVVDSAEAHGLAKALGRHAAEIPILAVKAQVGEPLGAGGALQTAALLEVLRRGVVPAIHGFETADSGAPDLCRPTTSLELPPRETVRRGLVTSLGLDGHAAALVFETLDRAPRPRGDAP
ncbi:MAG: beta-ketoacyl synthase N-terminal-like domain-containing protein [Acidobacteriota bacterium]